MKIRYLSLVSTAIGFALLLTAESSVAASGGYPNTGIAHPTYASQQARRRAASSYRTGTRIDRIPVESRRSFSYQPVVVHAFKAGEQVKIASDGVKLMRGRDTIATLQKGQQINILEVEGQWLGTSIETGGETKAGWVANKNVIGIADPGSSNSGTREEGTHQHGAAKLCH